MIYLYLFYEFFKTGLFALGGGLATFPFLSAIGEKYGWYSSLELSEMIAISESTPGSLGINTATYCGYRVAGIAGAVVSTIGEVLPSIIVICLVFNILERFKNNQYVNRAFEGIRPTAFALMMAAVVDIFLESILQFEAYRLSGRFLDLIDLRVLFIFFSVYLVNRRYKLHVFYYVIFSALAGILLGL